MDVSVLPTVNATLNGLSGLLLVAGGLFIRRKNIAVHRFCMVTAFVVSILFLASYLYYHSQAGSKHFEGTGYSRLVYFPLLISHSVLAAVVVPLVLVTLYRALREDFERHRRVARWTYPVWLYVSITGVLVYLMLYHWFP